MKKFMRSLLIALGFFALVSLTGVGAVKAQDNLGIIGVGGWNYLPHFLNTVDYMQLLQNRLYFNQVLTRTVGVNMISSTLVPRNVVVFDNQNPSNLIVLQNRFTGPFSVNTISFRVNDDMFWRIANDVTLTENIDVSVDTGNNSISFNTVAGNLSTGDVDISIR